MHVRDASADDCKSLGIPVYEGYRTWTGLLDTDDGIKGHITISQAPGGQDVFGHDTRCWSDDARGALLLWRAAKAKAHEWGATHANVHFEEGGDDSMKEFWADRGFKKEMEIWRGEI